MAGLSIKVLQQSIEQLDAESARFAKDIWISMIINFMIITKYDVYKDELVGCYSI